MNNYNIALASFRVSENNPILGSIIGVGTSKCSQYMKKKSFVGLLHFSENCIGVKNCAFALTLGGASDGSKSRGGGGEEAANYAACSLHFIVVMLLYYSFIGIKYVDL